MRYPEGKERLETDKVKAGGYFSVGSALELIKRIIGEENLDVLIQGDEELLYFLSNPEEFVEDPNVCEKMRSLNELLVMLGEEGHSFDLR